MTDGGRIIPAGFVDSIIAQRVAENRWIPDEWWFDVAKHYADSSRWARFCQRLWYIPWLPKRTRIWGMRVWNARYRSALPVRLRSKA